MSRPWVMDEKEYAEIVQKNVDAPLSDATRTAIGDVGGAKREKMPDDVFLEPASKKYPVKVKRDGQWVYSGQLLLAAARRARMNGDEALASRADGIRAKLMPEGKGSAGK